MGCIIPSNSNGTSQMNSTSPSESPAYIVVELSPIYNKLHPPPSPMINVCSMQIGVSEIINQE